MIPKPTPAEEQYFANMIALKHMDPRLYQEARIWPMTKYNMERLHKIVRQLSTISYDAGIKTKKPRRQYRWAGRIQVEGL